MSSMASMALVLVVVPGAWAGFATEPRASSAAGAAMACTRQKGVVLELRRFNGVVYRMEGVEMAPEFAETTPTKGAATEAFPEPGNRPKARRSNEE